MWEVGYAYAGKFFARMLELNRLAPDRGADQSKPCAGLQ
jgi:hypothetical protein